MRTALWVVRLVIPICHDNEYLDQRQRISLDICIIQCLAIELVMARFMNVFYWISAAYPHFIVERSSSLFVRLEAFAFENIDVDKS